MGTPIMPSSSQSQQPATLELSSAPGWGERLLPYLFAALECCWVDAFFIALVNLGIFDKQESVMPLWAPFILIASLYWFSRFLPMRFPADGNGSSVASGSAFIFLLIGLMNLFIIWASIYASVAWIIDPRWLLMLLNDLLLLNGNFFHLLGLIVLSTYLCRRGIRLSHRTIEPLDVFRALCLGLGIVIVAVLLGAGGKLTDGPILFLLIPLILSFALVTHALSQALFVRRSSPQGFQGNIASQERALLVVTGTIGVLLLLIAFAIGSFISPIFLVTLQQALAPLGKVYDWLISILAYSVVFLLSPLFWLISLLHPQTPLPKITVHHLSGTLSKVHPSRQTPETVLVTASVLKIVVPILCIIIIVALIWWVLRYRRRIVLVRRQEDIHESLWSWSLLWMQLKAFFSSLWRRCVPQRPVKEEVSVDEEELRGKPMIVRSIREIYRALLKWAAGHGYPRKRNETPYEFTARLNQNFPLIESELDVVTQAYTATRYGQVIPTEMEVADVQRAWLELQQKDDRR